MRTASTPFSSADVLSPVDFDLQGDSLVHTQIVCDTAAQKCAPSMHMPES
jgi:hypothetical protein